LEQFSGATNEHLAVGEGSTWYLHSRVAVSRILEFNPDARFIVMLRNPTDMVHALHSQLFNSCDEDVRNFQRAWDLQESRKSGRYIPPTCREPSFLQYGDVGKLGTHLDRLYRQVGKDRVHVIIYDDFCEDTLGAYRDTLDFLGLSWDCRVNFPVSNPNRVMKSPMLGRIAMRPSKARIAAAGMVRRVLGIETLGFSDLVNRLNFRRQKRRPLPMDFRAALQNHFREDIDRLSQTLNRDLTHWHETAERRPDRSRPTAITA